MYHLVMMTALIARESKDLCRNETKDHALLVSISVAFKAPLYTIIMFPSHVVHCIINW